MVHAFVTSRVDYCNTVLHRVSEANVQSLQNVLNAAARMIYASGSKFDHITIDIRDRLHWLPVRQRIEYKACVLELVSASASCTNIPCWTVLIVSESASCGHLHGWSAWLRGRTSVSGQRSFAVLRSICSWWIIHHLCGLAVRYRSTKQVNSAFHRPGVHKWIAGCN